MASPTPQRMLHDYVRECAAKNGFRLEHASGITKIMLPGSLHHVSFQCYPKTNDVITCSVILVSSSGPVSGNNKEVDVDSPSSFDEVAEWVLGEATKWLVED